MKPIPILTLRRLPQYLSILYRARAEGKTGISATYLADITGVHMTQVRKDLAITGVQGVPKVGHKVDDLIHSIEQFLNWNDASSCMLVGTGNLGAALLGYQDFSRTGLHIVAAFDTDPSKVGEHIHGVPVYDTDKFINLSRRMHVHIGILTVPPEVAQETAEIMIEGGIRAIWNFTPVFLQTPPAIIVENVDLFSSLAVLSHRLADYLKNTTEEI